jgi:hypothetical protein
LAGPDKSDTVIYVTLAGFILTLAQLERSIVYQRAATIREQVSEFHTNEYLQRIFFDLIYTYVDRQYDALKRELDAKFPSTDDRQEARRQQGPIFGGLEGGGCNHERAVGSRLWHPELFQLSAEEKRLDSLLGYLDVVAYQWSSGVLTLEDVRGSLGYYLEIIAGRQCVKDYFKYITETWDGTPYGKRGAPMPYLHLTSLLSTIDDESARETARRRERQRHDAGA